MASASLSALFTAFQRFPRNEGLEGAQHSVQLPQLGSVSFRDLAFHLLEHGSGLPGSEEESVGGCQDRDQSVLLVLVVKDFAFSSSLRSLELGTEGRVPEGDGYRSRQVVGSLLNDEYPVVHHRKVSDLRIAVGAHFSFSTHSDVPTEERGARDSDVRENGVPVVFILVAVLRPDVPHFHPGQWHVVFHGTDRHDEGLRPVILPFHDEPCNHKGVIPHFAELSRPELGSLQGGCMDDELVNANVEGGCGLNSLNVRAMAQLSLGVAPNHLEALGLRHPILGLLS